MDARIRVDLIEEAKGSSRRSLYQKLEYNLNELNYFSDNFSVFEISNIFRIKGELLDLNYRPYFNEE